MKRILVPTDFSDCSFLAIDYAANLARKTSGEIYLLHVFEGELPDTSPDVGGSWAAATNDLVSVPYMIGRLKIIKSQMQKLIEERGLKDINVYDELETGEPYIKIKHAATKYETDIIIMGTHGAHGLTEKFI